MEIFANDEVCLTKIISPLDSSASLEIFADDGKAAFQRIQVWPMETIW
ncbi:MAG: GH32 C-terminal domain-containing protein [Limisphaerales bacterium]